MNYLYIEHYGTRLVMFLLLKITNSYISTGYLKLSLYIDIYIYIYIFGILNTTVQVLAMILMPKITTSNI